MSRTVLPEVGDMITTGFSEDECHHQIYRLSDLVAVRCLEDPKTAVYKHCNMSVLGGGHTRTGRTAASASAVFHITQKSSSSRDSSSPRPSSPRMASPSISRPATFKDALPHVQRRQTLPPASAFTPKAKKQSPDAESIITISTGKASTPISKALHSLKALDITSPLNVLPVPTSGEQSGIRSVRRWLKDTLNWEITGTEVSAFYLLPPIRMLIQDSAQCIQKFTNISLDEYESVEAELEASGLRCAS